MTQSCKDRIFLVGPMGAGKSSIGKALALVTESTFYDIDEEIVKYAKRSIPRIFEDDGEEGFRQIETEVLQKCVNYNAVIGTGGGIIGRECNRKILKENGLIIYLYADVETQYLRTMHDNNRPMIHVDDRRAKLEQIFKLRNPLYNEVQDLIIDSGKNNIHECVEQIKARLKELSWKI